MNLVHVLKATIAQVCGIVQPGTTRGHIAGVVPHMQGQVPGACVREGNRNAGLYFIAPPKHRISTLEARLLEEIGNVEVIRAAARQVRLHNGRKVDVEA